MDVENAGRLLPVHRIVAVRTDRAGAGRSGERNSVVFQSAYYGGCDGQRYDHHSRGM